MAGHSQGRGLNDYQYYDALIFLSQGSEDLEFRCLGPKGTLCRAFGAVLALGQ